MGGDAAFFGGNAGWGVAAFGGGTGGGPPVEVCGECPRGLTGGTFGGPLLSTFGVGRGGANLPLLVFFGTGGGGAVLRGDSGGGVIEI